MYSVCRVGTKRLIENYIGEVCRQLDMICETEHEDFPAPEKYEFFMNTQRSFGRTALLLSGGAIFGIV
jgi:TAG lipase/steryl ester hydrolase/phospholipase A2/LPA acyltransferase